MTSAGVQERQDVLLRDGRIAAIGSGVTAPTGAEIIDASGRPLTPALFAGITALGLNEVNMVRPSVDSGVTQVGSPEMRPEFTVIPAYNPHSSLIPITRIEGFGFSVLGATAAGSIIGGQGRAVMLDGGYDSFVGEPLLFVALGEGASALAGGIKAVTSAANFERTQVAFGTLIGDAASPRPASRPPSSASNNKAGNWKPPKWIPCRASPEKSRAPLRRTRLPSRPNPHTRRRNRLARRSHPPHATRATRTVSTQFAATKRRADPLDRHR
jgi:hypothetical protein